MAHNQCMSLAQQSVEQTTAIVPGVFYLATAASADITLLLPSVDSVSNGALIAVKRVNSSGNNVIVAPAPGELVNGLPAGVVLSAQGQGRFFHPHAPNGPAAGKGWMSY